MAWRSPPSATPRRVGRAAPPAQATPPARPVTARNATRVATKQARLTGTILGSSADGFQILSAPLRRFLAVPRLSPRASTGSAQTDGREARPSWSRGRKRCLVVVQDRADALCVPEVGVRARVREVDEE